MSASCGQLTPAEFSLPPENYDGSSGHQTMMPVSFRWPLADVTQPAGLIRLTGQSRSSGPRSLWGARAGRAVHSAVRTGAVRYRAKASPA